LETRRKTILDNLGYFSPELGRHLILSSFTVNKSKLVDMEVKVALEGVVEAEATLLKK